MSARQAIGMPEMRDHFGYPCFYTAAAKAEERRRDAQDVADEPSMATLAEMFSFGDLLEALPYAEEALALALATGDATMIGKVVLAARQAQLYRLYRYAHYEGLDAPDIGAEAMKAITPALRGAV